MGLTFREARATQAAGRLMQRNGGTMSYMKLLKLLYLSDRRSLVETGRPITFDHYRLMKHGPVLSGTYDLMVAEPDPLVRSYWHRHISAPLKYNVSLLTAPGTDQLSRSDERTLDAVYDEFGSLGRWDLVRYTHTLPEWHPPAGLSAPLPLRDVLRGAGVDDANADAIVETLAAEQSVEQLGS